jgi:cholesterol transport system auxiliary component
MKRLAIVAVLSVVAGCAMSPRSGDAARFDFGPMSAAPGLGAISLGDIEVRAPTWLDTSAMQYRLAYGEAAQRRSYADSRWVAPPAALIEQALQQRFLTAAAPAGGCRLHLEMDEFIQEFSSATASQARLEVRAWLLPPRDRMPLARHAFVVVEPAPSADARGGVAAAAKTVAALGDKLRAWLDQIDHEVPAVAHQCGGG